VLQWEYKLRKENNMIGHEDGLNTDHLPTGFSEVPEAEVAADQNGISAREEILGILEGMMPDEQAEMLEKIDEMRRDINRRDIRNGNIPPLPLSQDPDDVVERNSYSF
jgi:hypothetical protein